jgi:hypothetical protein
MEFKDQYPVDGLVPRRSDSILGNKMEIYRERFNDKEEIRRLDPTLVKEYRFGTLVMEVTAR